MIDNCKIPIINESDLVFAELGKNKAADGRIMKPRIIMNFDGFTLTFDKSGVIYKN